MQNRISLPWSALIVALSASCAPGATDLRPDAVATGQGAVMGRVRVFKGDDEVTGSCYLRLKDERDAIVSNLSLDDSGWVFTALPVGTTYLSRVSCAVWNGLYYHTGALDFEVHGGGAVTYFGHLRFDLADEDAKALANAIGTAAVSVPVGTVAGALASNAITTTAAVIHDQSPDGRNHVSVRDESGAAEREYHARFRGTPRTAIVLAGQSLLHARERTPSVVRNGDLVVAEAQLDGVTLMWLGSLAGDQGKLAFRLQRFVRQPALRGCSEVELVFDGDSRRLPLAYKVERASMAMKETVQAEIDVELLKTITSAKAVAFNACTLSRTLSEHARGVATKFLATYEAGSAAATPVTVTQEASE